MAFDNEQQARDFATLNGRIGAIQFALEGLMATHPDGRAIADALKAEAKRISAAPHMPIVAGQPTPIDMAIGFERSAVEIAERVESLISERAAHMDL